MTIDTDLDFPKGARASKEEVERIKAFRRPDFVPPYPYYRSKFAESAKAEAARWAKEHSLEEIYKTPEDLQALYDTDFPESAMVAFVDCGEKETVWAAKYFLWMFLFDDRLDDITNFRFLEKSMAIFLELNMLVMWSFPDDEEMRKNFVELLDKVELAERTQALNNLQLKLDEARKKPGTIYDTSSPQVHPLTKSFRDLWVPLCETMPADFLRRFAILFQHQLLGNLTEIRNRQYETIPSVDDYIACRRNSIALWTIPLAVEYTDKVHLPDAVFYCSEMQRFLLAANDVITWHNDLWSFQKEALMGDVHNLVIVVSNAQGCSYREAGTKVYQMMLDRMAEMEKAIDDLEMVTPTEYQHAISRYVFFLRTFVTGMKVWHDACPRYVLLNDSTHSKQTD